MFSVISQIVSISVPNLWYYGAWAILAQSKLSSIGYFSYFSYYI